MDQSNLLKNIIEFYNKSRSRKIEGKNKKDTYERACSLHEGQELFCNALRSGISAIKRSKRKGFKTLTPKKMRQKLPIALE